MTLKVAYQLFCEKHPNEKISLSKFCNLCPPQVNVYSKLPHNVCLCRYHEKIKLLLEALQPFVQVPTKFREFLATVACDQESVNFMLGNKL